MIPPLSRLVRQWANLFLLLACALRAQAASGLLDSTFDPGTGTDHVIHALVVQTDGKILIGGAFTQFNGVPRRGIARLLPDGALDHGFDPGSGIGGMATPQTGLAVHALALQADGRVLVGGEFTTFNGEERLRLVRLNQDGSMDPAFRAGVAGHPAEDPNSSPFIRRMISGVLLHRDGRITIVGEFDSVNGIAQSRAARLLPDGSVDSGFRPDSYLSSLLSPTALLLPDGDELLVAGSPSFNAIGNKLVRLCADGSPDITNGFD